MNRPEEQRRALPQNIEAEQALLGAILVHNGALDRVGDHLEAGHFYDPLHGRIFEALRKTIMSGQRATPVTLKTVFEGEEPITPNLTVPQYLGHLAGNATTIMSAPSYAKTIYDLAIRRELILFGEDVIEEASRSDVDADPSEQLAHAEQQLFTLARTGTAQDRLTDLTGAVTKAIDNIAQAYKRDSGTYGIATGFKDLDQKLGGLAPTDLIILAGRPSIGKTALATDIAYNAARLWQMEQSEQGSPVALFSCEMASDQLAMRLLAEYTGISSERMRRGRIDKAEFDKIADIARSQLTDVPVFIDDTGGLSIDRLMSRARRLKRQANIGLILIDYLQLLTPGRRYSGQRTQEVAEITNQLKALAKELEVPIVALSQLSRNVESREDKRPQLADLRESGAIEQDADVVMFVYREEYYVARRQPKQDSPHWEDWKQEMAACEGVAEVIIAKQRHGPTGTVELQFDSDLTRFRDLVKQDHLPMGV